MRRHLFLLTLSLPVLLLAGCRADSYFCDHDGCYYCDGLGCRPADPVDPAPECVSNDDCAAGELCTDGLCRPEADVCQFSYECGGGRVCVDGRCAAECAVEADCPEALICDAGFCRPVPEPAQSCTVDGDCAATEFCDAGTCRFDDRPLPPVCTVDGDCLGGRTCQEGVCRTPCTEDLECQLVDVQLRYCVSGLCVTQNEVISDCATSADCTDPEICLDGVCQ